GLVFGRQAFLFDANAGVDGQAPGDGPGVLEEERVVVAGDVSAGAEVVDADVTELSLTCGGLVGCLDRKAIGFAYGSLRGVSASAANKEIDARNVVVLIDGIGEVVQLIAEL